MSPEFKANLAVMGAALLWASAGVIGESSVLPPVVLAEIRLGVAAMLLLVLLGLPRVRQALVRMRLPIAVCAVVGMGLFQWGYFVAVDRVGASFATWSTVATGPLWAAAIARTNRSQQLAVTGVEWLEHLVIGLGLMLMVIGGNVSLIGLLLALIVGLTYAIYASAANRAALDHPAISEADGSLAVTTLALTGGALILLPLAWPAFSELGHQSWQLVDGWRLAFLGLGSTALAYFFFAKGVSRISAEKALALQWIQPVATEIFNACATEYRLNLAYFVGAVLLTATMIHTSLRTSLNTPTITSNS